MLYNRIISSVNISSTLETLRNQRPPITITTDEESQGYHNAHRMLYSTSRKYLHKRVCQLAKQDTMGNGMLTHRNGQTTNSDLDTTDDDHGVFDATMSEPLISVECEDKAEHVFENK